LTIFGSEYIHWVPPTKELSAIVNATRYIRPQNMPPWMGGTMIANALHGCMQQLVRTDEGDRAVILIAATDAEYRDEYGPPLGDGTDACGSYLMREEARFKLDLVGDVRGAVTVNNKDWGQRYVRHAAGLAYAHGATKDSGTQLPLWLLHGLASVTSRFDNDSEAGWFGKQHISKGGVRNLKGFFAAFAINGEMESKEIDYNIFQAGLMVSYATAGGDEKVSEAYKAAVAALTTQGKGGDKAIAKLEATLIEAEPKIVTYLQGLIAKAPRQKSTFPSRVRPLRASACQTHSSAHSPCSRHS
jgi:hypothetical protein